MLFTGSYEHTIDAKGRLSIPSDVRSQWRVEEDGAAWYVTPWISEGVLRLYTEAYFRSRAAGYARSLTPDPDEAALNATLFGLSARLEMDSAGRVRVPEETLEIVGLGREVALVGAGDWLEVRDRGAWRDSVRSRLEHLPQLLERIAAKSRDGAST